MNNLDPDVAERPDELIVYGGAMHGFTHETAVQPVNGVAYNATADARSSRAIQTFIDELVTPSYADR